MPITIHQEKLPLKTFLKILSFAQFTKFFIQNNHNQMYKVSFWLFPLSKHCYVQKYANKDVGYGKKGPTRRSVCTIFNT